MMIPNKLKVQYFRNICCGPKGSLHFRKEKMKTKLTLVKSAFDFVQIIREINANMNQIIFESTTENKIWLSISVSLVGIKINRNWSTLNFPAVACILQFDIEWHLLFRSVKFHKKSESMRSDLADIFLSRNSC